MHHFLRRSAYILYLTVLTGQKHMTVVIIASHHFYLLAHHHKGFPGGSVDKESAYNTGDRVGKIPWRRAWQPIPVFLPGKSHGQGSLAATVHRSRKELDTTEVTECAYESPQSPFIESDPSKPAFLPLLPFGKPASSCFNFAPPSSPLPLPVL